MKYHQPYGISDPNGSYVNGNPSTGTMGSIPPAASIEFPQREVVGVISSSGQSPDDGDLLQLARGIQGGRLNYAVDNGTASAYQITVQPTLLAYAAGQRWSIMVGNSNTGPSTLNVNALGARAIVYPNGTPLAGGEMQAGAIVSVIFDGSVFQMQNIAANLLAAPKIYYVNASIGSDTAYDGTAAAITGTKGPFATIQKAINTAVKWNQNGWAISIKVADGFYPPFYALMVNGSGGIDIGGNDANPAACLIHSTAGEAVQFGAAGYSMHGFKVQADGPGAANHYGDGIRISTVGATIYNIDFGACSDRQLCVDSGAVCAIPGLDSALSSTITASGSAPYHMYISANAYIYLGHPALKVLNNISIGVWCQCAVDSTLFGSYASQTLTGSVTGQKHNVSMNGAVATSQGVNYFPGTVAGALSTGGQFS